MPSSAASSAEPPVICPITDCPPCAATSTEPIRYDNGELQLSVTDLASTGFGGTLRHARKYCNQLLQGAQPVSKDYGNGYNWLINNLPHITYGSDGEGSYIAAVFDSQSAFWFNSSTYAPRYGAQHKLTYANQIYTLTAPDGRKWQFYDFTQDSHPDGALIQAFLPGGQTITTTYDDTLLTELEQTDGQTTESLQYAYDELNGADVIASITLVRGGTNLRRVVYAYYESDVTGKGSIGDLKSATRQEYIDGDWVTRDVRYYRYYTSNGTVGENVYGFNYIYGFQHGLKYVFGPEGYCRMVAAGKDPDTADDNDIAEFADNYYAYDNGNQKVIVEIVAGGTQIYTFSRTTQTPTVGGVNQWCTKTVETRPDGSTLTVYTNNIGQPLLKHLAEASPGTDKWIEYFVYGEASHNANRLIEHWTPAAVTDYDDDGGTYSDELVVTADEDGLIHLTDYYSSTTATASAAGGVEGYVQFQKVKEGDSGTAIKISETKYIARSDGDTTIYPVAEQIVYQSDASGGSDPATTRFSHAWYFGTHQTQERTTTLPAVSADKNGSGVSDTRKEYFDSYGNLTWMIDELGRVTHHQYDAATGARTRSIEDVDGCQSAALDPPEGYEGNSDGLHLTSDFLPDSQGRVTRSLGPVHTAVADEEAASARTAVWTVYDDVNHQVRSARGYATESVPDSGNWDTFTLVNPVSIAKQDNGGRTIESISAVWSDTLAEFLAAEQNGFPQPTFVRWTTNQYATTGRLDSTRVYHQIPDAGVGFSDTHYAQTTVDYDATGRQNMQTSPGGTIARTTFDCRGNRIGDYVGTNDFGETDDDPTNSGAGGNNMKLVAEHDYEGTGGSCACSGGLTGGLLSTLTKHVDDSTTRVVYYDYDWRNRRETTTSSDGSTTFVLKNTHDNLGRATQTDRYHTSVVAGNLVGRDKTYHDERGQVYKTERYAVDPSDGTVGNALTDNTWYDDAGRTIKQQTAGSQTFSKTSYDGLGRPVKQSVGCDESEASGATDEDSYAHASSLAGDILFEQTETFYDDAGSPTLMVSRSRLHDATGTGELTTPDGSQPKARVSYSATWYDPLGRQIVAAAYGTNGGAAPTRPDAPPTPSDTVLVSTTEYDSTGQAYRTIDAKGRDDRREFDAAGRVVRTISNYCSGSNADDKNVTVEHTYTIDGALSTQTAKNSTTGDQVTQYAYGTTLTDSEIADTRLLRGVVYPDSQNTFTMSGGAPTFSDTGGYNRVEFTYNRQGEQVTKKDQNETVHTFEYDLLGRQTSDKITAVGGDLFQGILRIEHDYEVRGMVEQVTSYDAATGGYSVNDVKLSYDDFGLLKTDQQEHLGDVSVSTLQVQYAHANGADNHARLNTITYPNGRVLHHEYSSGNDSDLSRVSYLSETNGSGTRYAEYTYLGAGQIVRVDCNKIGANDPTHSHNLAFGAGNDPYDGLDQFGRVIDLRWTNYAGTSDKVRIKHGYDRAGNRLYREDTVSKSQGTPVYLDELYAYDGMYQLTSLRRGQLNSTEDDLVADSKKFAEQWTLDPLGNWTNFKQDTDADSDWELDQNRTHNKANEIAAITGEGVEVAHDAAGNMVVAPKPEDWGDHYHFIYDPWDRLVEVQTADQTKMVRAYEYDGLNRMIGKWSYDEDAWSLSEWRHYYYSDQWQFLEERVADSYTGSYSGSGIPGFSGWGIYGSGVASNFRLDRQFVWGLRYVNDLVLRDRDTDTNGSLDERIYALQDPNWNVVAIANTSGTILKRFCYSAYGAPEYFTSDFSDSTAGYDWDTLFCGYRYDYHADSDVKWHIAGHRILLSHLGRWNRRDPILDDDNPCRYVGNSPTNASDPTGMKVYALCYYWQCDITFIMGSWWPKWLEVGPGDDPESVCASWGSSSYYSGIMKIEPDKPLPLPSQPSLPPTPPNNPDDDVANKAGNELIDKIIGQLDKLPDSEGKVAKYLRILRLALKSGKSTTMSNATMRTCEGFIEQPDFTGCMLCCHAIVTLVPENPLGPLVCQAACAQGFCGE